MKDTLDQLNKMYGLNYVKVVESGEKIHPIYLKHLKAIFEIERIYVLVKEDKISLGKAKELTAGVIEHFVKMPLLTEEEMGKIKEEYSEKWKKNNPEYPQADYLSGVNDGMYLLRNTIQKKLGIKVEGDIL